MGTLDDCLALDQRAWNSEELFSRFICGFDLPDQMKGGFPSDGFRVLTYRSQTRVEVLH